MRTFEERETHGKTGRFDGWREPQRQFTLDLDFSLNSVQSQLHRD